MKQNNHENKNHNNITISQNTVKHSEYRPVPRKCIISFTLYFFLLKSRNVT